MTNTLLNNILPLEIKIHIFAPPCNIRYILYHIITISYHIIFYSILFYSILFYSILLHYITLHYITLHYIILYYIILYYIILYYIILYYIILYYIILYYIILYYIILYYNCRHCRRCFQYVALTLQYLDENVDYLRYWLFVHLFFFKCTNLKELSTVVSILPWTYCLAKKLLSTLCNSSPLDE